MRTKTLLIAAAALAVTALSASAQTYSQNVVGYANVVTPANGQDYLLSVPFNIGVSNGANEIWPVVGGVPSLPDFSEVLIWNPATFTYTGYYSDSSSGSGWDDSSFTPLPGAPTLPVGQGFFLIPSGNVTNTFAGTVAVNVGTSNVMSLPANGQDFLVGCVVPYAGAVTNGTPVTGVGGPNLSAAAGLPDFSELLIWNPATFNYTGYYSDSSSGSGWDDSSFTPLPAPPTIGVGQAFFIIPSGNFNWTVGL